MVRSSLRLTQQPIMREDVRIGAKRIAGRCRVERRHAAPCETAR
jgi:hypothetical protein